jgi:hypothetical protein
LLRSRRGNQCFRHIGVMDMEQNVADRYMTIFSAAVR